MTASASTTGGRPPSAGAGGAQAPRRSFRDLGRALRYLKPYVSVAAGALFSLLMVTAATLVLPLFVRLLIDRGFPHQQIASDGVTTVLVAGTWRWIVISSAALLGIAVTRGIFNFLQGYLAEKASQGVAFDLRNALFAKLQSLSFSYHDQQQTGQLMIRMTSDVEVVRTFSGQGILNLLAAGIALIGTLVLLAILNGRLMGVTFTMVPLVLGVFVVLITRIFPMFRLAQQKLGGLTTVLQENLAGVAVVKAFAREAHERERYEDANVDLFRQNLKIIFAVSAAFPMIMLITNLVNIAVVWYGGSEVIHTRLSLGTLVAFMTYLGFLMSPLFQVGFTSNLMSRAGASAARIFEVLDAESEVREKPGAEILGDIRGEIEFDDVSFRYVGQEKNILDGVTLRVEPGQTVAVVGTTGSGKSTLINLIPRFYDVTAGAIRIDGHDVQDVTISSLRSNIGIVLQESTLFAGTIKDNIAFGKPEASIDEIRTAARAAQADEFISGFPDGYETVIGERGITLSGGQRQRVAIARTLLVDPRILLMDDSTSSVDAETEYRMQQALDGLLEGRTSMVIAHRVSTVRRAHRILVLDGGRLVADGDHEDLLATSPVYGEIVDSQLQPVVTLDLPEGL